MLQQEAATKPQDADEVKPESAQKAKPSEPLGQDPLLSEQTVSNKEQRKADWKIIKEMSRYLWPKDHLGTRVRVGASVALLIGAKVLRCCAPSLLLHVLRTHVGPQCASALLLQEHR